MNTAGIKIGDIVECDVRGDLFYGLVTQPLHRDEVLRKKVVTVRSLTGRPIPTGYVTAFQIKKHWRLRGQPKGKKS